MTAPKSSDVIKLFLKAQSGTVFETPDVFIPVSTGTANNPVVESLERSVATGTGSNLAPVMGRRQISDTLPMEVSGVDYSASEVPFIDPVLQGVGMLGAFAFALPVTITANTDFNVVVTGVTSSATANVTVPAQIGDTLLYVDTIVGTFDVGGEALEISASSIGSSSAGIEQQSMEYNYVANKDIVPLSMRLEEDFQKTEGFNGNLTVSFEAPASQLLNANVTLQAKFNQDAGEDIYRKDIVSMTDTSSFVDKQPATFDCARFEIDGIKDLVASGTFTLDMGADVQVRPNVNQCDGTEGMFIPARKPTFSFRVEQMPNTQWEYYQTWVGSTTSKAYYRYGDTQYNIMHFIMPAFKITAVSPSNENNISYVEISGEITGTNNNDLRILLT